MSNFYSENLFESSEFQTYNTRDNFMRNTRIGTSTLPKELSVAVVLNVCFPLHCSLARMKLKKVPLNIIRVFKSDVLNIRVDVPNKTVVF